MFQKRRSTGSKKKKNSDPKLQSKYFWDEHREHILSVPLVLSYMYPLVKDTPTLREFHGKQSFNKCWRKRENEHQRALLWMPTRTDLYIKKEGSL